MRAHRLIFGVPIVCMPVALALMAGTAAAADAANMSLSPMRAETFVDSLGVNVHVTYPDTPYQDLDAMVSALRYLGVDNLRDSAQAFAPGGNGRFATLARDGFKFDFITSGNLQVKLTWIDSLQSRFPGSVSAIEGPNEVNNFPIKYDGETGTEAAVAFQSALYAAVKADPVLRDVPVYNFTDYPDAAGQADFVNIHVYPKSGRQPGTAIANSLAAYAGLMPGKPAVMTEAGYPTLKAPTKWGGVNPTTQARLITNLLLDSAKLGIHRVYLYELFDGKADPTGTNAYDNFGLFNVAYTPKPAAVAIHNLVGLLRDNAGDATSFATQPFPFTITNLPETAKTLLLEKQNGTDIVAIWNEPEIWNPVAFQPISHPPTTLTLQVPGAPRTISVYDPLKSAAAEKTVQGADTVTFSLGEDPIFVSFSSD